MTAEKLARDAAFQQATFGYVHFGQRPDVDLSTFGPSGVVRDAIGLLMAKAAAFEAREREEGRRQRAFDAALYPDPDCENPAPN